MQWFIKDETNEKQHGRDDNRRQFFSQVEFFQPVAMTVTVAMTMTVIVAFRVVYSTAVFMGVCFYHCAATVREIDDEKYMNK